MTEHTLGTVPLRRRGPRQGLRLADPKQADRHRLARQRARDIVVVIKRTASRRGASPDRPPQGGGSPRGALPGGRGSNSRALVPLLQQRFNDDDMARRRESTKGLISRTNRCSLRKGKCSTRPPCMERPSCMEITHAWIPFDFGSNNDNLLHFNEDDIIASLCEGIYLHHLNSSYFLSSGSGLACMECGTMTRDSV